MTRRFQQQLQALVGTADEAALSDRLQKGCRYYLDVLTPLVADWPKLVGLDIDNREVSRSYEELTERIARQLRVRVRCLEQVAKQGFTIEGYQRTKTDALLDDPAAAGKKGMSGRTSASRRSTPRTESEPADEVVQLLKAWRKEEY